MSTPVVCREQSPRFLAGLLLAYHGGVFLRKCVKWRRTAALFLALVALLCPMLQVHAELVTLTVIAVAGAVVVTALLVGMGISRGSDTAAFDAMVDRVLTRAGEILGKSMSTLNLYANPLGIAYVATEIYIAVKQAAFEEGVFEPQAAAGPVYQLTDYPDIQLPIYSGGGFFDPNPVRGSELYNFLLTLPYYDSLDLSLVGTKFGTFTFGLADDGASVLLFGTNTAGVSSCIAPCSGRYVFMPFYWPGQHMCAVYGFSRFSDGVLIGVFPGKVYGGTGQVVDEQLGGWELGNIPSAADNNITTDYPTWADAGVTINTAEGVITGSLTEGVEGTAEGTISIPVSVPDVLNPSYAGDMTQDQAQSGAISKDTVDAGATAAGEAEMDATLDKLVLPPDITGYFPFCIPFDIIRGLKMLSAPPVAPDLGFDLVAADYGIDWRWRMDWSSWQGIIAIVRWGEGLIFVIALVGATKRLVWG